MKKVLIKAALVTLLVLVLPFLLTLLFARKEHAASLDALDFAIIYQVNDIQKKLTFNEYLTGVVAANMSVGYHVEALKAQAVIARTYALYNIALLTEQNPEKTSFTTSELGLSYISLEDLKQLWGSDYNNSYFSKLENAVYGTKNEVLLYRKDLILPVFFDTGSGYTRNASEAWGVSVPYLTSVASKYDVTSTNYLSIDEFQLSELIDLLEKYYPELSLQESNFFSQVAVASRDSAGYVTQMNLGRQTVSGEEFAKVLGLASNHFYIEEYEGKARIICNGSGHGIGMSQYGANAMAEGGSSYTEILQYYYSGVSITDLSH
ncbi:stage II sporulation protein D [Anaerotaenia torta]|uniref:stage II sporulation protein D n=1 Tax=Anaerotaenia torta TaxID=433293 RepID=UPI003D1DC8ED